MVTLVTGASGFLGSHVRDRLEADGLQVVAADRPEAEIPSLAFDDLLARTNPEVVVHCATPASVGESLERPSEDFAGSVRVLESLLGRLSALPARPRVVFISSAAVYGEPARLPVDEGQAPAPVSPYGFHRLICELLLREYASVYAVPALSLRVFSAYGEGLSRQILWDICSQALETGAVALSGTGGETRDFVHARDVAQSVSLAIRSGNFDGGVYNVAGGVATSIRDLALALARELGIESEAVSFSGVSRSGDPLHWQADIRRIAALGFVPSVPLDKGVAAYAAWVKRELAPSVTRTPQQAGP